jgi:hypothetical protein
MQHPLLLPFGTDGWNDTLLKKGGLRLTAVEFYSFLMIKRVCHTNPFHLDTMLYQQYICNQNSKIAQQRPNYHRIKDKDLREEASNMLLDAALPTFRQLPKQAIRKRVMLSPIIYESPIAIQI